jgi:hypothetical protein
MVKQQQITKHGQSVRLLVSPLWYCPVKFPSYPSNSVHCYALFNILRVDHVRLFSFSSFSSYLTENSLSRLLLLDRPLFLRPQPVSHTEGSLLTLQRQMASLYVVIRIKNTEFRHVPSLRKVGYTWCQQGPETIAMRRKRPSSWQSNSFYFKTMHDHIPHQVPVWSLTLVETVQTSPSGFMGVSNASMWATSVFFNSARKKWWCKILPQPYSRYQKQPPGRV